MKVTFTIDKAIFDQVPSYRRAVIVATGIDNTADVTDLEAKIAEQTKNIRDQVTLDDPRIAAWRDVFAKFGMKARDFRPSVDAFTRRILNDKPLGSINALVDIGTVISLKFVLPAGAHPLLSDSTNIVLRPAHADEVEVLPDGGTEPVPQGEIILEDTGRIATRRLVWRQTHLSRIDKNTKDFYLNIDAIDPTEDFTYSAAISDAKDLIRQTFGVDTQSLILNKTNPSQTIEL